MVFIVDYNHCALNSRPSEAGHRSKNTEDKKGKAKPVQAKQKLSALLTQLQGKQCSVEEAAQFGFSVETEYCSCCNRAELSRSRQYNRSLLQQSHSSLTERTH